jgi:hypothetical protein
VRIAKTGKVSCDVYKFRQDATAGVKVRDYGKLMKLYTIMGPENLIRRIIDATDACYTKSD